MKLHTLLIAGLTAGGTLMAGPAPVADPKALPTPAPVEESRPRWWVAVGVDYQSAKLNFSRDSWNPSLDKPDIDLVFIDTQVPAFRSVEVPPRAEYDTETSSDRDDDDFDFGGREESWGPLVTVGFNFAQTAAGDFGISVGYTYHNFSISDSSSTGDAEYTEEVTSYYDFSDSVDKNAGAKISLPPGVQVYDSEKQTYDYTRKEHGSFDVEAHSIPLLFNWTVGTRVADRALNLVLAAGPTFDIYNWDLYHKVVWKGEGDTKSRKDSGSGTETRVGVLAKVGIQYSFDTQDRWYIEAAGTYRAGRSFTAEAGDAEGDFNGDGFGGQASIGFRF